MEFTTFAFVRSDHHSRAAALTALGEVFRRFSSGERSGGHLAGLEKAVELAGIQNPWFTRENILLSIESWAEALDGASVGKWLAQYEKDLSNNRPRNKIGMVMAGNIPMVGLHDLLCVFLSGHDARVKLSEQDKVLLPFVSGILSEHDPLWREQCIFTEGKLEDFDAIIATGSNNSSRYFEYYFGKYPHIIRRNRNSAAVIRGNESAEELEGLGLDIFAYFGLGCRNISKLYIPQGYDITELFPFFEKYNAVILHHKYVNNYDYQKSILIINRLPHRDSGFVLMTENDALVSPVSVIHYQYYDNERSLRAGLDRNEDQIQCVAGDLDDTETVPFGRTQFPCLWDYADQVDTMAFLLGME